MKRPSPYSLRVLVVLLFILITSFALVSSPVRSQEPATRSLDLLLDFYQLDAHHADIAGGAGQIGQESHQETRTTPQTTTKATAINATQAEPPSWSRIIFQSRRSGRWDIYGSKPDGTEIQQLTQGATLNIQPAMDRGGQRLLYVSNRIKRDKLSLQVMNIDGSNNYALTGGGSDDSYPSWSPLGYQIAFTSSRNDNTDVYRVNADKSDLRRLTYAEGYDGQPSWSPDGTQMVFTSNRTGIYSLWRMNADGSEQTQLTFGAPALFPAWSPRGDKIAFAADTTADGFLELWQMDADGQNFELLVGNFGQYDVWQPTWSPDGGWLGYQITTWTQQEGGWVWTSSYMEAFEDLDYIRQPIIDNQLWRPQWITLDNSAPGPCTPQLPATQTTPSFLIRLAANDVGISGVTTYQVAYRHAATTAWRELPALAAGPGIIYTGEATNQALQFRCRARDASLNWASWTDDLPTAWTTIDTTYPQSTVGVNASHINGNQATVHWQGTDPGGQIANYDIWLRAGEESTWNKWQDGTTTTSAILNGEPGKRYELRSQARDTTGHVEPWQPHAQASVTFYATTLDVIVTDNRGYPAIANTFQLTPAPVETRTVSPTNQVKMLLGNSQIHTLQVGNGKRNLLPPASIATNGDRTILWMFPAQDEQLRNGGFEAPLSVGWQVIGEAASQTDQARSGERAAQLFRTRMGSTTLSQQLTLPAKLHAPTLSWRHQADLSAGSFVVSVQSALSNTHVYKEPSALVIDYIDGWGTTWVDLTPYSGETITVTFALSNALGIVRIDEVSIGSWVTPRIESVSPSIWQSQQPVSFLITGTNFVTDATVYIGEMKLSAVQLHSPTTIQATAPAGLRQGKHDLIVINPDGTGGKLTKAITVDANEILLPIINRDYQIRITEGSADWPMLAQNLGRTAYNAQDPGGSHYTKIWTKKVTDDQYSPMFLAAVGNYVVATIHIQTYVTKIMGLNATTGEIYWERQHNYGERISGPTIAHDIVYYFGEEGSSGIFLFALDLKTGNEHWRISVEAQSQIDLSPTVVGNDAFFYGGYYGGVQGISAATGTLRWQSGVENYENRALAFDNGLLFGSVRDGLYAFNPEGGQKILLDTYSPYGRYLFPIVQSNRVIWGGNRAIDRTTGALAWQQTETNSGDFFVVDRNGILYRTNNGVLEAIQVADGSTLWRNVQGGLYNMVSAGAGNYIYAATTESTFVIDRHTQQVVTELPHNGLSIVANGYLYGGDQDGQIHAYRAERP